MAPRRHRAATPLPCRRGRAAERAIATIEMAILTPVMLLLFTFSTQAALWQEADHVALAAAESGVAAGAEVGGSSATAKGEAASAASQMDSGVLISPDVTVTEAGGGGGGGGRGGVGGRGGAAGAGTPGRGGRGAPPPPGGPPRVIASRSG